LFAGALLALTVVGDEPAGRDGAVTVMAFEGRHGAELVTAVGASIVAVRGERVAGDGVELSGTCVAHGQVLTSAHALDGMDAVTVESTSGAVLPARVVGVDPETDLALLAVDRLDAPPVATGSAGALETGDPVMAVAAGPGRHWARTGEVAGGARTVEAGRSVVAGLVDTGTRASAEQSGGAVVDDTGVVVGVLVVPPATDPSGLALPIEIARDVAVQLAATGRAEHGWLGVIGSDDTDRARGGALIERVRDGSPADGAGLVEGDVIVELADAHATTAIASMADLMGEIRRRRPRDVVQLTVLRGDGQLDVTAVLGAVTDSPATDGDAPAAPRSSDGGEPSG